MPLCYRTPAARSSAACTGRLSLLAPVLIVLAACTRSPAPKLASADSAPVARDTTDTFPVPLTGHYLKLLRARLSSPDPYQATVLIYCEQMRIMDLLAGQAGTPLEGEKKAVRLLKAAERLAYTPADKPARRRVDSALAGKVFDSDPGCDSLARAGQLGDTAIPPRKAGQF